MRGVCFRIQELRCLDETVRPGGDVWPISTDVREGDVRGTSGGGAVPDLTHISEMTRRFVSFYGYLPGLSYLAQC